MIVILCWFGGHSMYVTVPSAYASYSLQTMANDALGVTKAFYEVIAHPNIAQIREGRENWTATYTGD